MCMSQLSTLFGIDVIDLLQYSLSLLCTGFYFVFVFTSGPRGVLQTVLNHHACRATRYYHICVSVAPECGSCVPLICLIAPCIFSAARLSRLDSQSVDGCSVSRHIATFLPTDASFTSVLQRALVLQDLDCCWVAGGWWLVSSNRALTHCQSLFQ